MRTQYRCEAENRRRLVGASDRLVPETGGLQLNGIDYVEIASDDLREIDITFLKPDGVQAGDGTLMLTVENVRILGGERVRDPEVTGIGFAPQDTEGRIVRIRVARPGDFSIYRLSVADPASDAALPNMDPLLSEVPFNFLIDCNQGFDCRDDDACVPAPPTAPRLDYLAKDFNSFRRLMLDRMSLTMPDWTERSPADLGVTLVEVLADAADQLSYAQDAAATEAYLQTARRRASVQRHTRLTGYRLHDGANARTAVALAASADIIATDDDGLAFPVLPRGTQLLSRDPRTALALDEDAAEPILAAGGAVFETLTDLTDLRAARSDIPLYSWGDARCCLGVGATQAFLDGDRDALGLSAGDLLILEERHAAGDPTSVPGDTTRRHLVRLSEDPVAHLDHLDGTEVTEIRWHGADALPFPIWIERIADEEGVLVPTALAHGNVVLADHGRSMDFRDVPSDAPLTRSRGLRPWVAGDGDQPFRPVLDAAGPIAHAAPFAAAGLAQQPARDALVNDPRQAVPEVALYAGTERWNAQVDLLGSTRFATDFVLEPEPGEPASLRFGDNVFGRRPGNQEFRAVYRIGNGQSGNLGADALGRIVIPSGALAARLDEAVAAGLLRLANPLAARGAIEAGLRDGLTRVWNPIAATGGTDPEPILAGKLNAPQAFRTQRRAVTEADYVAAATAHPEVTRAVAIRRWFGSWDVMVITVDRAGGRPVDAAFEATLRAYLDPLRLAGHDIEIAPPRPVPLDIALVVCVEADFVRRDVERALQAVYSAGIARDGTLGLFHPDRLSFGEPIYLSRLIAAGMAVPGVQWIGLDNPGDGPDGRFRRRFVPEVDHGPAGVIEMAPLEIARLDNNPNQPDHGRLELIMLGGL